jgi:DNA-binding transcriptional MocR family regulator
MTPAEVEIRDQLRNWNGNGGPLYAALADELERLIRVGVLAPTTRLPSERRLAELLSVSRGTVVAAYEALRERGLVSARQGSGTVVNGGASPLSGPREAQLASALAGGSIFRGLLETGDGVLDFRSACWQGDDGLPADLFDLDGSMLAALRRTHGVFPAGISELRAAIADHLSARGLASRPEEVVVTAGAQQAIALLSQLFLARGDVVLVEDLTYPGAIEAFTAAEAQVVGVPLTPAGVDLDALDRMVARLRPRLVFLIPSANNPTGVTMPALARQRLAEMAGRWETVVIDNESLAETWLDEPLPAPVAAFGTGRPARPVAAEQVLTIGSLSKPAWGGLRIGWVRGPEATMARLARFRTSQDLATSALSQLVAVNVVRRLDELTARRRVEHRRRYQAVRDALARDLPEWSFQPPCGGHFLWVRIADASSLDFAPIAARAGVGIASGTLFSPRRAYNDHLRLPYGHPPEVLAEGVRRLAAAWEEYRSARDRCGQVDLLL